MGWDVRVEKGKSRGGEGSRSSKQAIDEKKKARTKNTGVRSGGFALFFCFFTSCLLPF